MALCVSHLPSHPLAASDLPNNRRMMRATSSAQGCFGAWVVPVILAPEKPCTLAPDWEERAQKFGPAEVRRGALKDTVSFNTIIDFTPPLLAANEAPVVLFMYSGLKGSTYQETHRFRTGPLAASLKGSAVPADLAAVVEAIAQTEQYVPTDKDKRQAVKSKIAASTAEDLDMGVVDRPRTP